MITTVRRTVAARALLLDVGQVAVGGDLAIPSDHASARQCCEAEEANKTHVGNGVQILCRATDCLIACIPASVVGKETRVRGSFSQLHTDCSRCGLNRGCHDEHFEDYETCAAMRHQKHGSSVRVVGRQAGDLAAGRAGGVVRRTLTAAVVAALSVGSTAAQEGATEIGPRLVKDPVVRAALDAVRRNEPAILEEQARLCGVAAPPFKEGVRAQAFRQSLDALGLGNVRIDKAGNVLGERAGVAIKPHLVLAAHLDTVFAEGTDVTVRRQGAVMAGPGIGDNCRGLAVLLGVVRALNEAKVQTQGSITFVGNVGEEGAGDLRGVKKLFLEDLKGRIDRFVSIDGAGSGITNIAVGSHRYKVTFRGPGGHSYGAFGLANPIHALGRAIARIAELQVPAQPKTTFNVGRVDGGTSVNSIAYAATMEVDLRSADPASLETVDVDFHRAVDGALADENRRWNNRGQVSVINELIGDRPAGRTPEDWPIVRAAVSVTRTLGLPVNLGEGSTDANIPMSLKIPSISVGGGGVGTGSHSPGEAFDSTDSWKGTQRALLLALALTQQ